MKSLFKCPTLCLVGFITLLLFNCKDGTSDRSIVGIYETEDENNQEIKYHISHIKDNIYGIKVDVYFDGAEAQTDYLEGSYNPKVRILTTKRSNVILNYEFSKDFQTIVLLGEENDLELKRKQ